MNEPEPDGIELPDAELRFDLGEYEETVLSLILLVRGLTAIALILTLLIWTLITANSVFGSRPVTYLFGWLPAIFVMGATVYLLGKLYE
ncbi:hypothetical protein [Natronosalvus rutilus]|uniref:Uncharacterized protein n=1 Tax=Natronosalvus rutilus TaxID=2953753 RepID=A0A9E7NFI7_9EURY|nr:hypothetical protein [Natronosalvus rutilus]UTF55893.1 hypothetical protein NGM29_20030 [Natronosalvus rutilus]